MMKDIDGQRDVMISHAQHEKDKMLSRVFCAVSGIFFAQKEVTTSFLQIHQMSGSLWSSSILPEFTNLTYESFEPRSIGISTEEQTQQPPSVQSSIHNQPPIIQVLPPTHHAHANQPIHSQPHNIQLNQQLNQAVHSRPKSMNQTQPIQLPIPARGARPLPLPTRRPIQNQSQVQSQVQNQTKEKQPQWEEYRTPG